MKRILTACMIGLATPALIAPPAIAQFGFGGIVFDPRNFAENVLTAARTLQQINNQIEQIQNQIEMLQNQARDLQNLPTSVANAIRLRLLSIDSLIRQAQGISYQIGVLERQYEELYAEDYQNTPPTSQKIDADARAAWQQSRQGYLHALQVQAGVTENVRANIVQLNALVGQSQSAAGNLQALQAGNQIAAMSTAQLLQLQELIAAGQRADALRQSEILAQEERARARSNNFLGDNSAYTPGN